ncbi:DoxX family protein [Ferrovibrio terrae]|jgi:putative oxidoreductase|uniref:DoxX family protein n=1 Tax=Ferrovibrio terrae TaxID=2594003 RepID=UPI003137B260
MALLEKFGPLLGRILIAYLYIPAGISKITGFGNTVGYITSKGLPMPEVGAVIAIVVEIVVAAALLVGFKTRYAALILAAFTLAAAVGFHNYWAVPDAQKMMQTIMFNKNLAIVGGLLFVAVFGAGPFSLDNRKN